MTDFLVFFHGGSTCGWTARPIGVHILSSKSMGSEQRSFGSYIKMSWSIAMIYSKMSARVPGVCALKHAQASFSIFILFLDK